MQIKPSSEIITLVAYFEQLFMKRNKIISVIRQQRVGLGTLSYFYKNGMGSKNSILYFLLSKTIYADGICESVAVAGVLSLKELALPIARQMPSYSSHI